MGKFCSEAKDELGRNEPVRRIPNSLDFFEQSNLEFSVKIVADMSEFVSEFHFHDSNEVEFSAVTIFKGTKFESNETCEKFLEPRGLHKFGDRLVFDVSRLWSEFQIEESNEEAMPESSE